MSHVIMTSLLLLAYSTGLTAQILSTEEASSTPGYADE